MKGKLNERFKDKSVEEIKQEMKKSLPDVDEETIKKCANWIKLEANL